jgi:N-acetylglucosaminyl-diphospho-decaprenol L-rhamnosyltransferase
MKFSVVNRVGMKDIAVIVVGLNACAYIKQCMESLLRAVWRTYTYEVIYVDNGSTDNTLVMLQDNFPRVTVIANPTNVGFCKAANQGARIANSRHYFFLNDDTIVRDDAIAALAGFLEQTPEAGVAGSRLLNPDLSDQWSGRGFPSFANALFGRRSVLSRLFPNAKPLVDYLHKDQIQGSAPFVVDWVSAAALMVRRETFDQVKGFAEDYYYWHEAVFCDRVRQTGKAVFLHPRSLIVHYEGQGSGVRPYRVRLWHVINFHQGAYRCYCEHYGLGRFSPLRWIVAAGLGARAIMLLVAHGFVGLKKRA